MNIEEAYSYLKYKNLKVGWYENITDYEVAKVSKTSFGWMIEIDYEDKLYDKNTFEQGSKLFKKSIHVDITDYNNWKAIDRNNKLNDLGINDN